MTTELLYLHTMTLLTCSAQVQEVKEENGKTSLILDQTVFYPKGGGQPYDTGEITSPNGTFRVNEVRILEGIVKHIGTFKSGHFSPGETVTCRVDANRRLLMSRLHTAGHIVDMAVQQMGLDWIPTKGFHFPEGAYVEYQSNLLNEDFARVREEIEKHANQFIDSGLATSIQFMPKEKVKEIYRHPIDYLPENRPVRMLFIANAGIPCGGTHVSNTADIGHIAIRKIKLEKGNIRVSYAIDEAPPK